MNRGSGIGDREGSCHFERSEKSRLSTSHSLSPNPDSRGFTLVEMLLAMTLFAIVMASSYSVFSMGLQIWKRLQGHSSVERKVLLSLEKMGRDVRGCLRVPEEKESITRKSIEYGGGSSEFSFPSIVTKAGKKGDFVTQTGKITYRFDASSRTICKKVENATDFYLKRKLSCDPVALQIRSFKFQYWLYDKIGKEYDWYDEWKMSQGVPKAVSVSFTLDPELKGAANSVKKEYRQVFMIPVGGVSS